MEFRISQVLKDFAKENKVSLVKYFFLSLAFPINDVVLPYYYGQVIEQASKSKRTNIWKKTRRTITIVLVLWALKQVLINRLDVLDSTFLPELQSHIRKALVSRILEAHKGNYSDPEVGRYLTEIAVIPTIVGDLFYQSRHFVLPVFLVVISTMCYLFYVHPHLGMIYLVGIACFGVLLYNFYKSCSILLDRKERLYLDINEEMADLLTNMLNVYSSGTGEEELIRLEKRLLELNKSYEDAMNCSAKYRTIFNITYMIIFVLLNGYAFKLYTKGELTLGSLSSVLIITLFVIRMMENASREIREFTADIGVLYRAQEAMNEIGMPPVPGRPLGKVHKGEIIVKNLKVGYGSRPILNIPELHIKGGETVAIIGKTGCGKSTFTKALVKLMPYEGSIFLDGNNLQDIDCDDLRRQIIYVPQMPRLFNRSILDNITYGTNATKEDVVNALRGLQITQIQETDLERSAGKNGSMLSGGQRQVVYFLRFLFRDGPVIIFDEPTASLDENSRDQVLRILRMMSQDRTTIIITHDPKVMQFASRRIRMDSYV